MRIACLTPCITMRIACLLCRMAGMGLRPLKEILYKVSFYTLTFLFFVKLWWNFHASCRKATGNICTTKCVFWRVRCSAVNNKTSWWHFWSSNRLTAVKRCRKWNIHWIISSSFATVSNSTDWKRRQGKLFVADWEYNSSIGHWNYSRYLKWHTKFNNSNLPKSRQWFVSTYPIAWSKKKLHPSHA